MTYRQPFKGEYPITQRYGETITSSFHTGIDFACPIGTPILASADGIVRYSAFDKTGYGNCVIIEHDITHSTLYAHLNKVQWHIIGHKVKQGDIIGYSGNTGNSTGPHLHFEARRKWNDFSSHFDPVSLPLMTVDDSVGISQPSLFPEQPSKLKSASDLKKDIQISALFGAFAHNSDFSSKRALPMGTRLIYTGKTIEHNGLTFCECRLLDTPVWIAVNDGEIQILDNLNFSSKHALPMGTRLIYTGKTIERNGLTFCEYHSLDDTPVWIAVNDGETQILDNIE